MESVREPARTTHPQVPFSTHTVDEEMLPVIAWCADLGIRTLASCQGGDRERPYILFTGLEDLKDFFHHATVLADLSGAVDLLRRMTGAGGNPVLGPDWQFEACPSSATRDGHFTDGLWGIVRFSDADLALLVDLLPQPGSYTFVSQHRGQG